ncbi:hypothetical protein [Solirubrum puertoriconensis]|uniref:Uncharacterized protein n=1 Tax=Solirubrum puertoriconensis TaxID=1751427 RepID=A0A9X0HMB1_SOLP1|nr:hypothetical protein [Solirubrum puertoriconensis]KUG08486.1 hypothetical protein ASU33_10000 [Solirubrum puertoriconensis]
MIYRSTCKVRQHYAKSVYNNSGQRVGLPARQLWQAAGSYSSAHGHHLNDTLTEAEGLARNKYANGLYGGSF